MSDFRKLVDQVASGKRMDEVSPPGFEGTVKSMKKDKDIDNPYALAWWMKNKGYKSSKKANGSSEEVTNEEGSVGTPASVDGLQNSVFGGADEFGLTPEDIQKLEMDEDGTGAPYDVNVATDPNDTNPRLNNPKGKMRVGESIIVDHPHKGRGTVLEINKTNIVVEWDNLQLSIFGPERVPFSEAKYLFRVYERYSSDPADVEIDGYKKKKKGKKEKKGKKVKKVREGGLASEEVPETTGELSTHSSSCEKEWTPKFQDDPDDSPDVTDFRAPGSGEDGVRSVVKDGVRAAMRSRAHRHDSRSGTRDKVHSNEGKQTMNKKTQLDEHMIAIPGTYRGRTSDFGDMPKLDLTMDDLLEYNVPEPRDSVLTTGDQSKDEKNAPLSTEAGASAAHDSPYPDGDMADDAPEDAPGLPDYDNIDDGGNERDVETSAEPKADLSGSSKSTKSKKSYDYSDSSSDSDDSNKDEEKDDVDESILSWKDIGLQIDEECGCDEDCGDDSDGMGVSNTAPSMANEDDGAVVGVAMSRELLERLLKDIREQQPDDEKLGYIASGLEAAAREKGSELGIEDIQMIMGEIKEAYTGQDVDADGDYGSETVENTPDGQQDSDPISDDGDSPNSVGNNEAEGYEFEDKAEGDGEEAGPEGGREHEGKTKLMDKNDTNEDVGSSGPTGSSGGSDDNGGANGSGGPTGGFGNEKAGKNSKPVSQNSTKGSGPGGSNTDGGGQDGSIPQVQKGTSRGTPGGPLSKEGGGHTVAPISESRTDEAMVAIGMASIGSVYRGGSNGPEIDPDDPDAEIKMIRRRAGLPNWWKV